MKTTINNSSDLFMLKGFNGFFSQEAYDYILEKGGDNAFSEVDTESEDFWTDFMYYKDNVYAVACDAPVDSIKGTAICMDVEGRIRDEIIEYRDENF